MSKESVEYKSLHKDMNFGNLSLAELNKLPSHNGVYNFKISKTSFLMLNIINDDSSVVKHFWKGSHDLEELDLWFEISKNEGVFIDVGAHTGLYTITSLKANPKNNVFCFEPYFMNISRLITNLRLNGIFKNVSSVLGAVSKIVLFGSELCTISKAVLNSLTFSKLVRVDILLVLIISSNRFCEFLSLKNIFDKNISPVSIFLTKSKYILSIFLTFLKLS